MGYLARIVTVAVLLAGLGILIHPPSSFADDHLNTAVAAGGLTTQSNPFTKTNGIAGADVPGQGSPLSGSDTTTPAVAADQISPHANVGNGVTRTPPPVQNGLTAPSANSVH